MTKRERQQFIKKATMLLLDLGAEETGDWYPYILTTKAGLLRLHVDGNSICGPGTVFGRFDDPEAARQFVDCNPHSGKWNHHYFGGGVDDAIYDLSITLKKII